MTDQTIGQAKENCPDALFASGLSFIEQLHAKLSARPCPNTNRIFLVGHDKATNKVILTNPACNMWSCEVCAYRLANRVVARAINGCNTHKVDGWFFITLTAHRKMRGLYPSYKNLKEGWKKLYNRARRKVGKFHYIKVYERHEDNTLHCHLIVSCDLSKRWWKDNSAECGMGYQVDVSKIVDNYTERGNIGMVAGYVAKYMTKQADGERNEPWPKNIRRFEFSRPWPDTMKDTDDDDKLDWTRCATPQQVFDLVTEIQARSNRSMTIYDAHDVQRKIIEYTSKE